MKLKHILISSFAIVAILPILIISTLLSISVTNLAKGLYKNNVKESITIQADYIEQFFIKSMVSYNKFLQRYEIVDYVDDRIVNDDQLFDKFRIFLNSTEDEVKACLLVGQDGDTVYSIGENNLIRSISQQLTEIPSDQNQHFQEFKVENDKYSLGLILPLKDQSGVTLGSFVVVYEENYIFKIISSYYNMTNASVFICQSNGSIINNKKTGSDALDQLYMESLREINFGEESDVSFQTDGHEYFGYYKALQNTPWYLVIFTDMTDIHSFINRFLLVDILVILAVLLCILILSVLLGRRIVRPINRLISVMEVYESNLDTTEPVSQPGRDYVEINYLYRKFNGLMQNVISTQKNLKKVYQLYHSITDMIGDITIDLDLAEDQAVCNDTEIHEQLNPEGGLSLQDRLHLICGFFPRDERHTAELLFNRIFDGQQNTASEANVHFSLRNDRWYRILVIPMFEKDTLVKLFIQMRDIHVQKSGEIESMAKSKTDSLTGLLNRAEFISRSDEILKDSQPGDSHAVLFIDMDHFKSVNDNFGHIKGDELLISVSEILTSGLEEKDIISRFGGDEFTVFLPATDEVQLETVVRQLNSKLQFCFSNDHIQIMVAASIGSAIWHYGSGDDLKQLLEQADTSMYQVKNSRKNTSLLS